MQCPRTCVLSDLHIHAYTSVLSATTSLSMICTCVHIVNATVVPCVCTINTSDFQSLLLMRSSQLDYCQVAKYLKVVLGVI